MSNTQDQYLLYRVCALHDGEAFDSLYRLYSEKIQTFIAYRVQRKEDAEDLTAQVFLNCWAYLTRDAPQASQAHNFRALIYKIARNETISFYRAQGRMSVVFNLDDPDDPLDVPDERQKIMEAQIKAEEHANLASYVEKLKDPYREVIILRFLEEMSISEIAQIVDKTEGNVRVLIHRAIKTLQKIAKKS